MEAENESDNAKVRTASASDAPGQKWRIVSLGAGAFQIVDAASGRALAMERNTFSGAVPAVVRTPDKDRSQVWYLEPLHITAAQKP